MQDDENEEAWLQLRQGVLDVCKVGQLLMYMLAQI